MSEVIHQGSVVVMTGMLLATVAGTARAQDSTTGAMRGQVRDRSTGDAVVGATVVASGPALQGTQATSTDETGSYAVPNLPPGTYQIDVYHADARFSRTNVLIQLGKVARRCMEATGIERRFTVHGMRYTFTDLVRRAKVDAVVRRALTGHVTERMQRHYSHVGNDEKRAALAGVLRLVPPASTPVPPKSVGTLVGTGRRARAEQDKGRRAGKRKRPQRLERDTGVASRRASNPVRATESRAAALKSAAGHATEGSGTRGVEPATFSLGIEKDTE